MVNATTGALSIDVVVQSKAWSALAPTKERVAALLQRAVGAALARAGVSLREGAELGVALADDETVRQLNGRWRGFDKPTNVLSFPSVEPDELAAAPHIGDIVLAFETVAREAEDDGKTLADHTAHLVVHGTLHLVGFDHETDAEAEEMEALEIAALADLGIADPYADLDLL
ncbi:MAG: rRNA maturation RNase YbeY [Pseudochelatococcus sp.]|jgi:probable rRNA maturation factor|uniref:rRNA maturation RNase YbeY n=1 Tax=Pseudochelatococcus sp. TaxID=2020869 RepID=UPI003D935B7A